jgi:hypothetical protein
MSLSGVQADVDGLAPSRPPARGGRWRVPALPRWPVPLYGALIYAGIRLLNVAFIDILLRHGVFASRHRSLVRTLRSADGGWYWAVAVHGYHYPAGHLAHAQVFSYFPGYPAAIDALAWLPGVTVVAAGLAVTALAGLAAAAGLTRLGLKLTGDPRIALLLVAVWAVAPAANVLSMMYAEALFCALAIWALVALTEQRWLTAAGLTFAAGLVRSTVFALLLALAAAAVTALISAARGRRPLATWWRPAAALILAPLGVLGYLGFVALATHRLDGWFWIEKHTYHMGFDGGASLLRLARHALTGAPGADQLLVLLAVAAAVVLALWSLTERIDWYLHLYTLTVMFLALSTSANWIGSKPRFILPAVLLALPVARLLAPVRTAVLVPLIVLLAGASAWFGLYLLLVPGWAP